MPDVADLTEHLRAQGDLDKKAWWDRYLKGAIEFYGVPMAGVRKTVHAWAGDAEPAELREVAFALLRQPIAEQKLAGILVMQELLLPAGELDADRDLPRIAACFDAGDITDWNTTDWLCVRVLGPMIRRGGKPVAEQLAAWVDAPSLWRRRSAAVAFVPVAGDGDALYADTLLGVCRRLADDPERFIQTGIGWSLRELSDAAPEQVHAFLIAHRDTLSREAVRMAAARLSDAQRTELGIAGKRRRR